MPFPFAQRPPPRAHVSLQQSPPRQRHTTVHRSLKAPTNAFHNLHPASARCKVGRGWWRPRAGTIFIVISQNSPGFVWKLACGSSRVALFQAADVTALVQPLIGLGGRREWSCVCRVGHVCDTQRQGDIFEAGCLLHQRCKKAGGYQSSGKRLPLLNSDCCSFLAHAKCPNLKCGPHKG